MLLIADAVEQDAYTIQARNDPRREALDVTDLVVKTYNGKG